MTQDDIIRMAQESGFSLTHSGIVKLWLANGADLERFAQLVAAAERKRRLSWTQDDWTEYERNIAAAEREACAKVCDDADYLGIAAKFCAETIRARGQQ